jgi:4-aminobutyrate aminotransferase-like enzyme
MMAVYLDNFDNLKKVINECLENGLVTDWFLFADNCMRIAPPLIITEDEIRVSCGIINKALDKVYPS